MDAIEIMERHDGEARFEIPDHVTLIVSYKTNFVQDEKSVTGNQSIPANTTYIPSMQKRIRNYEMQKNNSIPYKILVSTNANKITALNLFEAASVSRQSFPVVQLSSNAQTQTYFLESNIKGMENLNIFYCTFHNNGDVETYCNLPRTFSNYEMHESGGHCSRLNGVGLSRQKYNIATPFDDQRKHWIAPGKVIDRRKDARVKNVVEDMPSEVDLKMKEEQDFSIESTNGQPDAAAILAQKGYELRAQRLKKKFSDMQYSFIEKTKKKRSNFDVAMKCTHCSEEFSTFCRLEKHSKLAHNSTEFSFPCSVCDTTFTRPHNLRRHMETKHGGGERRYLCEHCGRRFNRPDVLATHTHLVHPKTMTNFKHKKFAIKKRRVNHCSSCDKFFTRIRNFDNHREGNLTCSNCSQVFACKTALRKHLYKHHSVACCQCGKMCANRQQLYFHTLSHSPKFSCLYCRKGFLWESQFIVHLATHTGNKPLNCDVCGKSFAHKNAVNKHKWQEHTEANKKFLCKFCDKSFVYKAKLESHLRSHTGEKPFSCHLCPSSFSHNCNLAAHVKCVHGIYLQSAKKEVQKKGVLTLKCNKKTFPKKKSSPDQTSEIGMPSETFPPEHASILNIQNCVQESAHSLQRTKAVPNPHQLYSTEAVPQTFNDEQEVYQILYAYSNQ